MSFLRIIIVTVESIVYIFTLSVFLVFTTMFISIQELEDTFVSSLINVGSLNLNKWIVTVCYRRGSSTTPQDSIRLRHTPALLGVYSLVFSIYFRYTSGNQELELTRYVSGRPNYF